MFIAGSFVVGSVVSGAPVSAVSASGSLFSGLPDSWVLLSGWDVSGFDSASAVFGASAVTVDSAGAEDGASEVTVPPVLLVFPLHPARESTINAAIIIDVNFFINTSILSWFNGSFRPPSIPVSSRRKRSPERGRRFLSAR